MSKKKLQILHIDDDKGCFALIRHMISQIRGGDFVIEWEETSEGAMKALKENRYDVYLLDYHLPECSGISILERAIANGCKRPIIMLTSEEGDQVDIQAMEAGASDYLNKKGLTTSLLARSIRYALERKRAEEQMRKSEKEYRSLFNRVADPIFVFSKETELFLDCNDSALRKYGYTLQDLQQMTPLDLHPGEELENVKRNIHQKNTDAPNTYTHLTRSGKRIRVEVLSDEIEYHGRPAWISIARDVTEREQLAQAQKLESIGQLAAGISHEINTPIQYIGDNTHFLTTAFEKLATVLEKNKRLLKAAKENAITEELIGDTEAAIERTNMEYLVEEIPMAIEETLGGIERVTTIVAAMKEFSHPGTKEKILTEINKALENTITVAQNEWKYVAKMVKNFDPSLPLVACLPGELNQVFLNLIVNAAQAIADVVQDESKGNGTIRVTTASTDDYVEIRISDSGTGIPEEARAKIFDPFFTTKEVGKGTGQGLAIAHNVVVEKHGGSIAFETEIGKGTTFVVRLPRKDFK